MSAQATLRLELLVEAKSVPATLMLCPRVCVWTWALLATS